MSKQKQEVRSMIVALKVTPSEKRRIEFVAGARGSDVSDLIREMGINEILEEAARVSEAVGSSR